MESEVNRTEDTDECECSHVYDEHEEGGGECAIEDCMCIQFERKHDDG